MVIIGGGAAGLATAIFTARKTSGRSIVVLDGAAKLGAKILVSGGGRCNVTNREVVAGDFSGGSRNVVRRILAEFPAERTVTLFEELGVSLHEEEHGKLFPDSNRADTVLAALLGECERRGVELRTASRVTGVRRGDEWFEVDVGDTRILARSVVLATGGKSLPKTGSDGVGYTFAEGLGHSMVPPTPALAPLILDGSFHKPLSGVSHEVELTLRSPGAKPVRCRGMMLWTHFGISGPVVLDMSRHWCRVKLEKREVSLTANFVPDDDLAGIDRRLQMTDGRSTLHFRHVVGRIVPVRVADALLERLGVDGNTPVGKVRREDRRAVSHALAEFPLPVIDTRGYKYAEVTAGGVPLREINPVTMESRCCPGLFLVGEILDVDGRIGGFNFQWSWSSAWVAGSALASRVHSDA